LVFDFILDARDNPDRAYERMSILGCRAQDNDREFNFAHRKIAGDSAASGGQNTVPARLFLFGKSRV
jgi:hypothetical protein